MVLLIAGKFNGHEMEGGTGSLLTVIVIKSVVYCEPLTSFVKIFILKVNIYS